MYRGRGTCETVERGNFYSGQNILQLYLIVKVFIFVNSKFRLLKKNGKKEVFNSGNSIGFPEITVLIGLTKI